MTSYYVCGDNALTLLDIKRYMHVTVDTDPFNDDVIIVFYSMSGELLVEDLTSEEITILTLSGTIPFKVTFKMFSPQLKILFNDGSIENLWEYPDNILTENAEI